MQKQLGSILLIAGTCIGSGMIALPMVLVKIGLIPSIILMLSIWAIMYYSSLINLELNLQAGEGLSLGSLAQRFSGPIAEAIGIISLKLLSYALLAAYIYGGSSIIEKLLGGHNNTMQITSLYALTAIALLLLPIHLVDYINRILFLGLLGIVAILIAGLASMINWAHVPLFAPYSMNINTYAELIPVVFTSFGFQVIFHTLTNYCNKDATMLKKAFLFGSLIPAVVYSFWICGVLSAVYNKSPLFYEQMVHAHIDVGDLIKELSCIAQWQSLQLLVWWVSLLAIATSVIGVGIGLCDSLKTMLIPYINHPLLRTCIASIITIAPAYVIALLVPNAFISVLGFAGMILAVIALLLPIYLLYKANITQFYYPELRKKYLLIGSAIAGLVIIACEVINMVMH
jgi:tyrosine-specific transport protein